MPPELPKITNAGSISPSGNISAPNAGALSEIGQGMGQLEWIAHQAIREENDAKLQGAVADFTLAKAHVDQTLQTDPQYADILRDPAKYTETRTKLMGQVRDGVLSNFQGTGTLRDRAAAELKSHFAADQVEQVKYATAMQVSNAQAEKEAAKTKNVTASVNAANPIEAHQLFQKALDVVRTDPYLSPGEKELETYKVTAQHDVMSLQKLSFDKPEAALAEMHAPDFAEKHPWIKPEEASAIETHAVSRITEGYRLAEDGLKVQMGTNEQRLSAEASQGKDIGPELERLAPFGGVSSDFYKAHMGHAFIQSMPGVRDSFISDIQRASSGEELDAVLERANLTAEHSLLSQKDYGAVSLAASAERRKMGTEAKTKEAFGDTELNKAFGFDVKDPMAKYEFETKPQEGAVKQFFKWRMLETKNDVGKALTETKEHFKDYLKDGSASGALGDVLRHAP